MADTTALKNQIEPFVRGWLRGRFGTEFRRKTVALTGHGTEGKHQFAAVSEDGKIVASVKNHSGRTTGKNLPSAKIDSSFADIYYLSLVQADQKLLILTDPEFHRLFSEQCAGMVVCGVEVRHCPLPPELERVKQKVREAASTEIDEGKTRY